MFTSGKDNYKTVSFCDGRTTTNGSYRYSSHFAAAGATVRPPFMTLPRRHKATHAWFKKKKLTFHCRACCLTWLLLVLQLIFRFWRISKRHYVSYDSLPIRRVLWCLSSSFEDYSCFEPTGKQENAEQIENLNCTCTLRWTVKTTGIRPYLRLIVCVCVWKTT